ncbi:hypothetical protein OEA41_003080 [Lepraria neglecta]|uniref:Phosphoglycerate mutase-like protein n=1 Tax=Lepraria neglecta TaxID=209136 RepID=A0AAE0DIN0_9LECA|nr:hypothetical protein OEA41_003080 [Lepraria neglecta]
MAADKDAGTPRVFLVRHGQTEWTINGRWTGSTADIPLTQFGESQISSSAQQLVGPGKLIDPEDLALVFVSPMQRARKTFELMFEPATRESLRAKVDFTKDLVEWGYGDYEGLSTAEIKQLREQRGLNAKDFDVFKHGCEGGESPEQVTERVDKLIMKIRELHAPNMHGENEACNVLLVSFHGA